MSQWSWCSLRCWRSVPPAPCTMHLGGPVVPDENMTYSGWLNATASTSGGPPAALCSHSFQPIARAGRAAVLNSSPGPSTSTTRRRVGSRSATAVTFSRQSNHLPPYLVAGRRDEHLRLDLAEAIEHALRAEVRRTRRPDGPNGRRREGRNHGLRDIRHVAAHPVARPDAFGTKRAAGAAHGVGQGPPAQRALGAAFIDGDDCRRLVVSSKEVLREVEPRVRKEARARHGPGCAIGRPLWSVTVTKPQKSHTAVQNRLGCAIENWCSAS